MLVPSISGVVGSIVLPVLGAVPDGAIVLFSGMGPDAQEQLNVGMGALAGSQVMLLTIPWVLSIVAGCVDVDAQGDCNYKRPPGVEKDKFQKLNPENAKFGSAKAGICLGPGVQSSAKIMAVTCLPYFIIQLPAFIIVTDDDDDAMPAEAEAESPYAGVAALISFLMFCWYLYLKYKESLEEGSFESEKAEKRHDAVAAKGIQQGTVSLRGVLEPEMEHIKAAQQESGKVAPEEGGDASKKKLNGRIKKLVSPYFTKYDADKSGSLDVAELSRMLAEMGDNVPKTQLKAIFDKIDVDSSNTISLDEFVGGIYLLVNGGSSPTSAPTKLPPLLVSDVEGGAPGEAELDDEESEEEEEEMPEDLKDLSPEEQQRRIKQRACFNMSVGILLLLLFCDPMCGVLAVLGDWINVSPFYVAFVIAPLASNSSELIAAYKFAGAKTPKSAEIAIGGLLGAGVMNNTFCLFIFLLLVWAQNLYWEFGAETILMLLIQVFMIYFSFKKNNTILDAVLIGCLYPGSIILVAVLEGVFGMS
mmetsp:Transcript_37006/g.82889  ORF Transcript_37006/g.82889 Transcript_37006/m.82889 type:complete len:530 (+) Transcript_37006:2-1591(+)